MADNGSSVNLYSNSEEGYKYTLIATLQDGEKNPKLQLISNDEYTPGDPEGIWYIDINNNHGRGPGGVHHIYNKKYDVYIKKGADNSAILEKRNPSAYEEPLLGFKGVDHKSTTYWLIYSLDNYPYYMVKNDANSVVFIPELQVDKEKNNWYQDFI